jgi:hypothetical protein
MLRDNFFIEEGWLRCIYLISVEPSLVQRKKCTVTATLERGEI